MAQLKNPPAPVSKTVQRLLAQIHAEAQAATLEALSAKDGIVTLQPMPTHQRRVHASRGQSILSIEGTDGSELRLHITHGETDRHGKVLPGPRWSVLHALLDGQGRKWSTWLGFYFITDDFGNLVSVEGSAA